TGKYHPVQTVEELQFPQHYYQRPGSEDSDLGKETGHEPESNTLINDIDIIRNGETRFVEFKAALRWNIHTNQPDSKIEKSALKTLVAFMNSDGGTLYVGVDDSGNV